MVRTVIVSFGTTEARRYQIDHTGHTGPGDYTHLRDQDYFDVAKQRLIAEGFDQVRADLATYRLAE